MTLLLLPLVIGCDPGPLGAPDGSSIVVSASDGLIFDLAYNTPNDGIGMLVAERAIVFDPDGSPLNGIFTEITSGWNNAYLLPAGAVLYVDDAEAGCEGDASDECAVWFDSATERYVEFASEYEDLGSMKPTYMSDATDNRGILSFYVFIDSVPSDDTGEVIPIPFFANIGVAMDTWSYDFE